MDKFLAEMAEILEEDSVQATDELERFESWDSLAVLSVVAMADEQFGVNLSAQDIRRADTVAELYQIITEKQSA